MKRARRNNVALKESLVSIARHGTGPRNGTTPTFKDWPSKRGTTHQHPEEALLTPACYFASCKDVSGEAFYSCHCVIRKPRGVAGHTQRGREILAGLRPDASRGTARPTEVTPCSNN